MKICTFKYDEELVGTSVSVVRKLYTVLHTSHIFAGRDTFFLAQLYLYYYTKIESKLLYCPSIVLYAKRFLLIVGVSMCLPRCKQGFWKVEKGSSHQILGNQAVYKPIHPPTTINSM